MNTMFETYFIINEVSVMSWILDCSIVDLIGMLCIGYVCVTQRKDPEEEVLVALS
jgi:hypothetical protein